MQLHIVTLGGGGGLTAYQIVTMTYVFLVPPRLVAEPHAAYLRLYEGFEEIKMNVTVKGGIPKAQVSLLSVYCFAVRSALNH